MCLTAGLNQKLFCVLVIDILFFGDFQFGPPSLIFLFVSRGFTDKRGILIGHVLLITKILLIGKLTWSETKKLEQNSSSNKKRFFVSTKTFDQLNPSLHAQHWKENFQSFLENQIETLTILTAGYPKYQNQKYMLHSSNSVHFLQVKHLTCICTS